MHESIVFGAKKPGYSAREIKQWIEFMQKKAIARVCCLLSKNQLNQYSDLLADYGVAFGQDRVCWAPIADFQLVDLEILCYQILPFLRSANDLGEKVVVHCSGGNGRTGHILAAWLVSDRGFSNQAAIAAVKGSGRNLYEFAIAAGLRGQNPLTAARQLDRLLDKCR